jgi:hypothetical protein
MIGADGGDERRISAGVGEDPRPLLFFGAGHEVEARRRGEHLGVVDVADRLGVAFERTPDLHRGRIVTPAGERPGYNRHERARPVRPAPLAQSAEHSHGKAGVVGSIPTGGSLAA